MRDITEFTGYEYLLIDCANHFGLDKETYEGRIAWANHYLNDLEGMVDQCPTKTRPLFIKSIMAIRDAQAGKPIGHLVGFDAICSGMQIMACLTGCYNSAKATGLIEPDHRSDAYNEVTEEMGKVMGNAYLIDRSDIKQGVMTSLYGSKAEPKRLFGEDTPEIEGFYKALSNTAPGPTALLDALLDSWQPFTLAHEWKLPDGHHARIKTMVKKEGRVEVDELGGVRFAYEWFENEGEERGVANAANVIHSIDAYILRCLVRRCNYDPAMMMNAAHDIEVTLLQRELDGQMLDIDAISHEAKALADRYQATKMADVRILQHATARDLTALDSDHLRKLGRIVDSMLNHKPFPVLSVHDESTLGSLIQ